MTDQSSQPVELQELLERFIQLANNMKDEGKPINTVNAALMLASCTYATFSTAGNEGYLKESGVEKVTEVYRQNLASLQVAKQNQQEAGKKQSS